MRTTAVILALSMFFGGCYAVPKNQGTAAIAPGSYADAFDAARETLIDLGFTLNRVDAAAGVVTTDPLSARGLAAPWERQQASRAGEIADTFHPQSRSVRIDFVPLSTLDALPADTARNQISVGQLDSQRGDQLGNQVGGLTRTSAALAARATVLIERTYRPGLRPQVADVVRSRRAVDPESDAGREFTVVIQRDTKLENVIAERIARELSPNG